MGLLDQLVGMAGGGDLHDFLSRYEQGRPDEGYDDKEVADRYRQVTGEVDPDTYEQAARDSFDRLEPDQRAELGRVLRDVAGKSGVGQAVGAGADSDDPGSLARLARQSHEQSPDLIGQLLGGGSGGGLTSLLGNPAVKGALAGIAAMAIKRATQQRR